MANEFKVKKGLIVQGSGSTVLDIQGSQGQLFSVTDSLSGSLFSVNDISGMPIMEVFSDDRVNLGTFNAEAIKVSGSTATVTGSLFGTASYATQALSASWAPVQVSASFATTASYASNADLLDGNHASAFVLYSQTSSMSVANATNATNATNIGVTDAGADTTTWVLLAGSQTGTQGAETDAGLTYNASTNALTATTFVGALTGNASTATSASFATTASYAATAGTVSSVSANITNNTNNNVLTATGGATVNGESNLTFTGTLLRVSGSDDTASSGVLEIATSGGTNLKLGGNTTYSWIQSHAAKPLYINQLGNNVILNSGGGDVGIGELSPAYKLDVSGSVRTQTGYIRGANSSADITIDGSTGSQIRYGNQKLILNSADAYIYTANTARLTVLNNGNIGMGATSPSTALHIARAAADAPIVRLQTTDSTSNGQIQWANSGNNVFAFIGSNSNVSDSSGNLEFATGGTTTRMMISSSGNVGIGTTSPSRKLHVVGSEWDNSAGGGVIFGNSSSVGASLTLQPLASVVTNGTNGWALYAGATGAAIGDGNLGFWAHGTNEARMVIQRGGNVGIGTTTPNATLDVNGNAIITGSLTVTGRITAEEFHTEFVSSSIIFQSGSTKFGDSSDDVMSVTGSLRVNGSITGSLFGTASYATTALNVVNNGVTSVATNNGLTGGTITSTGTIGLATAYGDTVNPYASKTANYVLAAPNGSAGVPSFRAIVSADIPTLNQNTTGNAATATVVTGTSGQLQTKDDRIIEPNSITTGRLQFGFTSWNNNNGSPYADYLHLRSYSDSSGGNDNLVMFRKDAIGMRIWQQTYGSATAYSSYKDVAWTDGTNASGNWTINVTGSLLGTASYATQALSATSAGSATTATTASFASSTNETLATVTGRGASTSTAVTLSSTANHFSGHHYFDAYDANGNHYPHYNPGGSNNGSKLNLRMFDTSGNVVLFYLNGADKAIQWNGNTIWHAGNDGASSGLDADLLDGNHASAFVLNSQTSSMAVGSATTAGSTTAAVTFSDSGAGAASGTTFNGSTARTISYNTIGAQPLLTNPVTGTGTSGRVAYWNGTNSITSDGDLTFDGSSLTVGSAVYTPTYATVTVESRSKLRLWGDDTNYAIGFISGVTYGGLNDYAMTFQVNEESDRGFWWGASSFTTAQGAMGLTTDGNLTVASRIKVGYGTSDTSTPSTYAIQANGNVDIVGTLTATVKSFIIDHPTKQGKKLQYGVLEGPEHSVYVRGKLTNNNTITLPDHWHALVHEDTITVNLTPIGKMQNLWVETVSDTTITVGSDNEINCYYTVFAERKDIEKLVTEFDK